MENRIIDARGLTCPQPVVLVKKALEEVDELIMIVDNDTARKNVSRLARKEGCDIDIDEKGEGIYLHLVRSGLNKAGSEEVSVTGYTIVVISSDEMGKGSSELGGLLMRTFVHTLTEVEPRPDRIIFLNSGVKLTTNSSPVLEDLRELEKHGIEIWVCGTCLQFFEIKEQLAVGEVSNMYSIAEVLLSADKTVTI